MRREAATRSAPVAIKMRSSETMGSMRFTVSAISESSRFAPSGKSCFGSALREAGQKRVPLPPARTMA